MSEDDPVLRAKPEAARDAPVVAGLEDRRLRGQLMHRLFGRPVTPATVGPYVIEAKLGQGGMGAVYLARDGQGQQVAIKTLLRSTAEALERLRREARAMSMIDHPNVVRVLETGVFEDGLYVAMQYVPGVTLRRWISTSAREPALVLAVFAALGRALGRTHECGLVHRDFKPDNVIVDDDDRPHLLDFGLSRALEGSQASAVTHFAGHLTATGARMGTVGYAAPEQMLGRQVDGRTDQFAYCVALYEALWGTRPFSGATADAVSLAAVQGRVDPPPQDDGVPARVWAALRRGLCNEPAGRFDSMDELVEALNRDAKSLRPWWRRSGRG